MKSEIELISDELAILVIGYDGYSDLWDDYFELLNKYWNDREYKVYLANNSKKVNYENVIGINCGDDAEWSQKVKTALEQIASPYICLLLEDFFTGAKINNDSINETVDLMRKDNIKYYKLNTFSPIKTKKYKNFDYLYTIPQDLEYGISLQPAIWEKDYLLKLLGNGNYNAWVFEYNRTKESQAKSSTPIEGCVYDNRNIFEIQHGVVQGKFIPPTIKYFKKQNYNLNTNNRPIMDEYSYFIYKLKVNSKNLVPKKYKNTVKTLLSKFGMKFVSDKVLK